MSLRISCWNHTQCMLQKPSDKNLGLADLDQDPGEKVTAPKNVSVSELISKSSKKRKKRPTKNSKKLKFKQHDQLPDDKNLNYNLKDKIQRSDSSESECGSDYRQPNHNIPKREPRKDTTSNTSKQGSQGVEVHEFGSKINGYRFVALNTNEVPEIQNINFTKHTVRPDPDFGYNQPLPHMGETPIDPYRTQNYMDDTHTDAFDYEEYEYQWRLIQEGNILVSIPLPVSTNKMEDLNSDSVMAFLKDKKNIKKERIRWHPDQMINRLKGVNYAGYDPIEAEKVVTMVFQIVNGLHEK